MFKDKVEHAFLYRRRMRDLGTLGGKNSVARGVNNKKELVGYSDIVKENVSHAFICRNGKMKDLGTLGGTRSIAWAINDSRMVVGDADLAGDHASHAFLYHNGKMEDLGTLGGTNSSAKAINASGLVAGDADTSMDAAHHAFLYSNGKMKDLGSLGGRNSYAYGINNNGQVVGYSETPSIAVPFRIGSNSQTRKVALPLQTPVINAFVNHSYPIYDHRFIFAHLGELYRNDHHAFLYDGNGQMLDLSQLPQALAAGWSSLNYAYGINDWGEIIGSGTIHGTSHAFLLSPVKAASE